MQIWESSLFPIWHLRSWIVTSLHDITKACYRILIITTHGIKMIMQSSLEIRQSNAVILLVTSTLTNLAFHVGKLAMPDYIRDSCTL